MDLDSYIENGLVHSVHTSWRRAFRSCRRRWDWAYRQGFHPKTMPTPLEFGIAYHAAMESWYDPDTWLKDRIGRSKLAIEVFRNTTKEQFERYVELNGYPNDEVIEDYRERVRLGGRMLEYYTNKISPILDKNLTPLAVELPFEVYLGFNCTCYQCWNLWCKWQDENDPAEAGQGPDKSLWSGLPATFGGRIDAVMQDEQGRVLVFDWKTTIRILDDYDEAAFLELDDQVAGYVVALTMLGRQVDGFIYHEQRKAVPETPKPLKRPYKGRLFSTDRTAAMEYETFINTIMKEDFLAYQAGAYDEYLEFLSGPMKPKFYQRHTIYKTNIQVDNFWNDLVNEAKDMLQDPRIYPQPSRFSCNSCLYRTPCEGQNRGEHYQYTLATMYIGDQQ